MTTTFYTSDTHFNHANICRYCPESRGHFLDVEAMNRDLIARWNARVGPEDIVYHLGDFTMGKEYAVQAPAIFAHLQGKEKHLIMGNHDRKVGVMRDMGWTTVQSDLMHLFSNGQRIYLRHHPLDYLALGAMGASFQLCGHVHQKWARARTEVRQDIGDPHDNYVHGTPDIKGRVINVGVDVRDLEPKTLQELLDSTRV